MNIFDKVLSFIVGIVDSIIGGNKVKSRIPDGQDPLTVNTALAYSKAVPTPEYANAFLARMQPAAYTTPNIQGQAPSLLDSFISKLNTAVSTSYSEYNQIAEQKNAAAENVGKPVQVSVDKPSILFYVGVAVIILVSFIALKKYVVK